jgi:hypothetical protein
VRDVDPEGFKRLDFAEGIRVSSFAITHWLSANRANSKARFMSFLQEDQNGLAAAIWVNLVNSTHRKVKTLSAFQGKDA